MAYVLFFLGGRSLQANKKQNIGQKYTKSFTCWKRLSALLANCSNATAAKLTISRGNPMLLDVRMIFSRLYIVSKGLLAGFVACFFKKHDFTLNTSNINPYASLMLTRYTVFLFSVLLLPNALATPKEVYRVDERPPDIIFSKGFTPWGKNDYLLAHVFGESLMQAGPEGSAFVATTETLEAAYRIAQTRFRLTPVGLQTRPLFIYEIRTDQNFYGVARYMEAMEENPPEGVNRRNIAFARAAFRYQREWVAAGGIPARQVRLARQIFFRDGQIVDEDTIKNEDFENADTQANEGIYPALGVLRFLGRQAFILNSTVEFLRGFAVTLAYCPPPVEDRKKRLAAVENVCPAPRVLYLDRDLTRLTEVLPLLLNDD